jgi:hypothetical protein
MGDQRSHSARLKSKRSAKEKAVSPEPTATQSDHDDPPQDDSDVYVPGGQDSDSDLTQSLEHVMS